MGSVYGGLAANIVGALPAPVNISSTTNTNPIQVTTSGAHGLRNGDTVSVNGHQTNTSANGQWVATVTGSNTLTIPVAGVGVGGATGTVQSLAAGAAATIPGDGDSGSAAVFNNPNITNLDRGAFLAAGLGAYKRVVNDNFQVSNDAAAVWASGTPTAVNTWTVISSGASGWPLQQNMFAGDLFRVSWTVTVIANPGSGVTSQKIGLMLGLGQPGNLPALSSFTKMSGTGFNLIVGGNNFVPITFDSGIFAIGGSSVLAQVAIGVFQAGATLGGVQLVGDTRATLEVWRPTGMPQ